MKQKRQVKSVILETIKKQKMLSAGITPRTDDVGYTMVLRPMTVPGLSTLLQPTST